MSTLWRERKDAEMSGWDKILPLMVDAYVEWDRERSTTTPNNRESPTPFALSDEIRSAHGEDHDTAVPPAPTTTTQWRIDLWDLATLQRELVVERPDGSQCAPTDLMKLGYIAKTPIQPTVVVAADRKSVV